MENEHGGQKVNPVESFLMFFVVIFVLVGLMIFLLYDNRRPKKAFKNRETPSGNHVISIKNDKIKGFRFLISYDNRIHCQFVDLDHDGHPGNDDYCSCFERNPHPSVAKNSDSSAALTIPIALMMAIPSKLYLLTLNV